jgi:glycolate oxidase FAD binding subunit
MKNVAGYDVSRLMTGALGTLGVLLEVSLKVLPKPAVETTLCMTMPEAAAIEKMNQWAGKPLPVSATCFAGGQLLIRLSGAEPAVRAARAELGGEVVQDDTIFWRSVPEHTHDFFQPDQQLWRLSVKSTAPSLHLPGKQLLEWNGALRWLCTTGGDETEVIRRAAQEAGGHATLFRSDAMCSAVFHPLPPALMKIHRALKEKFDPAGIFNPGRLYPGI